MMRTLEQAGDLAGKRVLLRADLDVPVSDGNIADAFRVRRQSGQLRDLLDAGARVVVIAHISAVGSFAPLRERLGELLDVPLGFLPSPDDIGGFWSGSGKVALLENLRTWPGETEEDEAFARRIAQGADMLVNNAFAVCHRAHASVTLLAGILPSFAGALVVEEVHQLGRVISEPARGKVVFMGGAKASTKVPVIRRLIDGAERIAVGGVVANDILRERGEDIDDSQADADAHELLQGLDVQDVRLLVPQDSVRDGGRIMDIGPLTAEAFAKAARDAALAVWNGPMGKFEDPRFLAGTRALAEALAASPGFTVIGGGDTIAAVAACGIAPERYGFVSTGGGAMLAFLAGAPMPGLNALGYPDAIQ